MDAKGLMMLKVLINHYNPKAGNALLKFLPQEEAKAVVNQAITSSDLSPLLYQPQRTIEKLHYSWLMPLIEKLPKQLQPLALSCLTAEQVAGLRRFIPVHPVMASLPVKNFILNQLYSYLKEHEQEPLPLEYLPDTELSPLAAWNKKQLTTLIDFLGLYDLAAEVRHIVNKTYLKNLYGCLSPKQLYYLKVCLHQKEKLVTPKLGIDPTKQDCAKLLQILHKRGLIRLGKALASQHSDLAWHIAHTLDIGRGRLILQHYNLDVTPQVTQALKLQVINLMNFLKKEQQA